MSGIGPARLNGAATRNALLLLALAPFAAHAQFYTGGTQLRSFELRGLADSPIGPLPIRVLGAFSVSPERDDIEWSSAPWPAEGFVMAPGGPPTGPDADRYPQGVFSPDAVEAPPASIGLDDRFYAMRRCGDGCETVGWLWVEGMGEALHWYASDALGGASFIDVAPDEEVLYLPAQPGADPRPRPVIHQDLL